MKEQDYDKSVSTPTRKGNYQTQINMAGNPQFSAPYYKSTHSQQIQKALNQQSISNQISQFLKSKTAQILVSLLFNGLAVVMFIIYSYLEAYKINPPASFSLNMKIVLLVFFIIEYLEHMLNSSNKKQESLKFSNVLDLFTILFISHDIYDSLDKKMTSMEDKVLWTLLCFKFLKVKQQIISLVFKTHVQPNPDKLPPIIPQHQQLRKATFSILINIFTLCLINTSLILLADEIIDGRLLSPYIDKKLQFHNALYFQIITMTTIGYGDVTPVQASGRVLTTIFILICAVLFTKWFGEILNLAEKEEGTMKKIKKQTTNNIIIIGNIFSNSNHIENFLKNHFSKKYSSKKSKFIKQLTFVSNTPPNHDPNAYIQFEGLRISYGIHQIKYFLVSSFENDLGWIKKAGLQRASALMCFNYEDNDNSAYNSERNIIFSLGLIRKKFPKLKIYTFFTTDLILTETKLIDSSSAFINRINCRKKYMNYCLISQMENEGVGSVLQQLLFNKDRINGFTQSFFSSLKNDENIQLNIKHNLIDYFNSSQNEIYCRKFPHFLIGESFVNIAKFLYLYSYTNPQAIDQIRSSQLGSKEIRVLLIGVKSASLKRVLPNPGHYRIKEGDKGLFIAENQESVSFIENLNAEAKSFYDQNFEFPSISMNSANEIVNDMIASSIKKSRASPVKDGLYQSTHLNFFGGGSVPLLKNHFICAGMEEEDICEVYFSLRKLNPIRAIIFIQNKPFQSVPTRLKEETNVFFIQTSLNDGKHLKHLQIKDCEKVVIRISKDMAHLSNIELFRFYRLVQEYYPNTSILLSLNDDKYLDFFDKRPFQNKLFQAYWPLVMNGTAILEPTLFHSMNTLMFYENSVASLLIQIAGIAQRNTIQNGSNIQELYKGGLYTFEVTRKCANEIKQFGDLQFHFLGRKEPLIALAIIKKNQQNELKLPLKPQDEDCDFYDGDDEISEKVNAKLRDQSEDEQNHSYIQGGYDNNANVKEHLLFEQIDLMKFNTDVIITNPPPYQTQLSYQDKIVLLGSIDYKSYAESKLIEQDQFSKEQQKQQQQQIDQLGQEKEEINHLVDKQISLTNNLLHLYEAYNKTLSSLTVS